MAALGAWVGDRTGSAVIGVMIGGLSGGLASVLIYLTRRANKRLIARSIMALALASVVTLGLVGALHDSDAPSPPPPRPPPPPPSSASVDLAVLRWCYCSITGSSEIQIKLKVAVRNSSKRTVNIAPGKNSRIVLAVAAYARSDFWLSPYTPPYRRSGRWFFIPPNPPDYQVVPRDFVTHWDGRRLAPSKTYVRRGKNQGDLVFSVSPRLGRRLPNSIRLAYAEPRRTPYFPPSGLRSQWPPDQSDPLTF